MDFFKNKVVIITGASSGIGKACAEEFAKRGANLVLAARQYVTLCEITADLERRYSIKAIAVQVDVSKEEDCILMVKQALVTFNKIDMLINNAGLSMRALFNEVELAVLKNLMDVNFWGAVYCTKYALPEILKTKGSIIGVSSIAGYRGLPGRTGYSSSKFAMNGFMESLRTELLKTGVHVMVACPGFTTSNIRVAALAKDGTSHGETSMEEGKMMSAEEVAVNIANGIAARKRTLIMTGQGKLTVWINKLLPALADKLVFNHFTKEKNALVK
ncbi:SDR family oxidoreductase [Pedobacter heparinus]|uniref:Short-chain dehydrogenase/reductase SDR n=1 Tax=Pedobacter heparinus (strain ATCC 13125 / DSM 2366 / CIP 104194 / JCM 7457 / NBRC 12017 / NCIMB 9290 / NRRL B-14731 / HIM 762-3) TaxID=485917 RepID=C6Y2L5_PEDHD|nr:SDR family oxidoreductase [Pedobacter heparinus]ACU05225.1 short-chain dehydrogenase/reductase SDR [Pedobacter heparinus DSM 2366]